MNRSSIACPLEELTPCKWRQFTQTNSASGTPKVLTRRSVTSMTRTTGKRLVTVVATAHEFATGDYVTHSGANETPFNISARITRVDADTYTFELNSSQDLAEVPVSASGTLLADGELWYRHATFYGTKAVRSANTGTVYLGPGSTNDGQPISIAASGETVISAAVGARCNLKDLYLDVATNDDGVVIMFH